MKPNTYDQTSLKDFIEKYEAFENQTIDELVQTHRASKPELKDLIDGLILNRELLKDCEIECLQHQADKLLEKLKQNELAQLKETIECFKDVLALHKRLVENERSQN